MRLTILTVLATLSVAGISHAAKNMKPNMTPILQAQSFQPQAPTAYCPYRAKNPLFAKTDFKTWYDEKNGISEKSAR